MNKNDLDMFSFGYGECRNVMLFRLRAILKLESPSGVLEQIERLILESEEDIRRELWQSIQEEFPGISKEEYEAELDQFSKSIAGTGYGKESPRKSRPHIIERGEETFGRKKS